MICTDKTGTLTANEMTVRRVWTLEADLDVERCRLRARSGDVTARSGRRDREALERAARAPGRSATTRPSSAHGGALADHRRPDGGRAAHASRTRPASTPMRGGASLSAPRRAAVRLGAQAHDHPARGARGADRLRQGRADRGRRRARRSTTPRMSRGAGGRRRAGARSAARARGRAAPASRRGVTAERGRLEQELEFLGLVGHARPAAPRGRRRGPGLPAARASGSSW